MPIYRATFQDYKEGCSVLGLSCRWPGTITRFPRPFIPTSLSSRFGRIMRSPDKEESVILWSIGNRTFEVQTNIFRNEKWIYSRCSLFLYPFLGLFPYFAFRHVITYSDSKWREKCQKYTNEIMLTGIVCQGVFSGQKLLLMLTR